MENKLVYFIKWTVFELACNPNLCIRNYCDTRAPSALMIGLQQNSNNVDITIQNIVNELMSNSVFLKLLDDSYDDSIEDIFNFFVNTVGLYQIFNLHADDRDIFQEKFETLIRS